LYCSWNNETNQKDYEIRKVLIQIILAWKDRVGGVILKPRSSNLQLYLAFEFMSTYKHISNDTVTTIHNNLYNKNGDDIEDNEHGYDDIHNDNDVHSYTSSYGSTMSPIHMMQSNPTSSSPSSSSNSVNHNQYHYYDENEHEHADTPLLHISFTQSPTMSKAKCFLRNEEIKIITCQHDFILNEILSKTIKVMINKNSIMDFSSGLEIHEGYLAPIHPPSLTSNTENEVLMEVGEEDEHHGNHIDSDNDCELREDTTNLLFDHDNNEMDQELDSYHHKHDRNVSSSSSSSSSSSLYYIISFILLSSLSVFTTIYISTISTNDPYFYQNEFNLTQIASLSKNKTFVITGANAGLGYSSTKLLSIAGEADLIVMACRTLSKCRDARDEIMSTVQATRRCYDKTNSNNGRDDSDGDYVIHAGGHSDNDDCEADRGPDVKNITNDGACIAHRHGFQMKPTLVVLELDLASLQSIKKFSVELQDVLWEQGKGDISRESPKIDVLINNAGIMCCPYEIIKPMNTEIQMAVNHIGHFALTSLLLKNLENGGRIVNVSSLAGAFGFFLDWDDVNYTKERRLFFRQYFTTLQSIAAYGASKRANQIFTHGLDKKLSHRGIDAVVAHPGYSRTALMMNGWSFASNFVKKLAKNNVVLSMSSDDGSLPQLRAALDVEHVKSDSYVAPLGFTMGRPVVVGTSIKSFHHFFWSVMDENAEIQSLWEYSETAIGWSFD